MRTRLLISIALWAFLAGHLPAQVPREVMSIVLYEQERVQGDAFILVTHSDGTQQRYPLKDLIWWQTSRNDPFAENEALIVRVFAEYLAQGWEIFSVSEKTFRKSEQEAQRNFTRYLLWRPKGY